MVFLPDSVQAERIKEEQDYEGVRVHLRALLQNARIDLQIDIGFGDCVVPPAVEADFPTLLDAPAPRLRVYPMEVAFAEKLETIVTLGLVNSRLKDYFDLWLLAHSGLEETTLIQSIRATFNRRETAIPKETPSGLTPAYAQNPDRAKQWTAFQKRVSATACPSSLEQMVSDLARYTSPLFSRISSESSSSKV